MDELKIAAGEIKKSAGDKNAIITLTSTIAAAVNKIIAGTKSIADIADPQTRNQLQAGSKAVADSVTSLMTASKVAAATPHNILAQQGLVATTEKLEGTCQQLVGSCLTQNNNAIT